MKHVGSKQSLKGKFGPDPATTGRGGLRTVGETQATKALLAKGHAKRTQGK